MLEGVLTYDPKIGAARIERRAAASTPHFAAGYGALFEQSARLQRVRSVARPATGETNRGEFIFPRAIENQ